MKQKTFFIVFEGLSFGEKNKFDKKYWTLALNKYQLDEIHKRTSNKVGRLQGFFHGHFCETFKTFYSTYLSKYPPHFQT